MSNDVRVNSRITIPAWELEFSASRSSGPGGQAVNKTNSRVSLKWHVANSSALDRFQKSRLLRKLKHRVNSAGYLDIHVESERSQLKNKMIACERLAELIRDALIIEKKRFKTKPTRGSKERRIKAKKEKSQTKKLRRSPIQHD